MPTYSALLTVYNREAAVIAAHLRSLKRSLAADDQVVIVDDGSTDPATTSARRVAERLFERFAWIRLDDYPAFRIAGGYNNPAKAFNTALEHATGDVLFLLSSDVLVTPKAVAVAKAVDLSACVHTPTVVDIETLSVLCGASNLQPFPWMLCCEKRHAIGCGGWDETFLGGMCAEDNDFAARLIATAGGLHVGPEVVFHMTHDQPAWTAPEAVERNRAWCRKKWGGRIPLWEDPFIRATSDLGAYELGLHSPRRIARAIGMTKSPFVAHSEPRSVAGILGAREDLGESR